MVNGNGAARLLEGSEGDQQHSPLASEASAMDSGEGQPAALGDLPFFLAVSGTAAAEILALVGYLLGA